MGSHQRTSRQATYGPQQHLTLKSRLFVLLRDELGLGRKPKIAQLLCDEIVKLVDACFVSEDQLRIGQVLVLAPEVGQRNSFRNGIEHLKLRPVRLTLLLPEDIAALASGTPANQVRMTRIERMVKEAYNQGACLTNTQLGLLTGLSPSVVSKHVRDYNETHDDTLPLRGIVEDCSSATSHKTEVIQLHLDGLTTTQIAQKTSHNPKSVERYVRRFNQVREFVHYLDRIPEPAVVARVLGIGEKLARAYLELVPIDKPPLSTDADK
jgi:hypothetical protein